MQIKDEWRSVFKLARKNLFYAEEQPTSEDELANHILAAVAPLIAIDAIEACAARVESRVARGQLRSLVARALADDLRDEVPRILGIGVDA